jgi:pyruvate dehydrogenase E2 component (dihydrolipoamide acetyltransferase)
MPGVSAVAVEVPDIGDFDDVPVIEILVSEGDTVAAEDPLVTLESDKATMDVPAPFAGTVKAITVKIGDRVSQGSALLEIEPSDGAPTGTAASQAASDGAGSEAEAPDAIGSAGEAETQAGESAPGPSGEAESAAAPESSAGDQRAPSEREPAQTNGSSPPYASPSVRRMAREMSVDLARVQGSGRKGRIVKADLERAKSGGVPAPDAPSRQAGGGGGLALDLPPWPTIDFTKFGEVQRVQRSRIQRISAPVLARNWVMIPHVTHNDEADITALEAWRKQLNKEHEREGVKFTMVTFLVAASVATLKAFENFNASLDGEELILKRYYNIGFAADTPGGLVVPVIKDADRKGLAEIARELTELSSKARDGKLAPGDMQGATFTISSLGGIGGTSFTPIINAPEVAILGVTRAAMKPVWDGSAFVPRLIVPLSLSYDHRVIDGAAAARFVVHLTGVLSDLRRALL